MIYYSPILAALVTILLTAIFLRSKLGKAMQDVPNARSLHTRPTPRIGGVALLAGVMSGWMLMLDSLTWWVTLPLLGLFVVSLADDMRNLPVRQRLLVHLLAAAILVVGSGVFAQQNFAISLVVLLLTVWMTNLFNFMDGSDGLAGGMALFGFGFYGIAALEQHAIFALLNFTVAAAALGFLIHNFHPAKIFMGDAGSIPLGFLAMAMGFWGWQQGCWGMWFPLLVFSPFIVDATVTLVRRTLRGARITEAHREHYYQRAVQMGWSHRKVAYAEYALMLFCGVSGLAIVQQAWPWQVLGLWTMIYFILMRALDARWKKHR
ncbi:MAG TPA: glycosyltransferase family 4 protein [Sideroxyarcus sp.]|nr:glycosyltransferase family 4 protein [Sideroxyarcus sp.]